MSYVRSFYILYQGARAFAKNTAHNYDLKKKIPGESFAKLYQNELPSRCPAIPVRFQTNF